MKVLFVAITAFLLLASMATAKEMTTEEVAKALDEIASLKNLQVVKADSYSDGSVFLILRYDGSNTGVKISRYEIKNLEKYLAPKQLVISEPEPRVVEKIIKVEIPGPERVVEKEIKVSVPGPTRFIVREALPAILLAGAFFLGGRIAEDRYEKSLEPEITKKIEPGHATVRISYQGNDWLRRLSDASYAAGGIALSIPIFRQIF